MKTDFKKRKGRRIIVNGVEWVYRVGSQYTKALSESGERRGDYNHVIKGIEDPEVFARGQWKRTSDGMLTPRDIEFWLKNER